MKKNIKNFKIKKLLFFTILVFFTIFNINCKKIEKEIKNTVFNIIYCKNKKEKFSFEINEKKFNNLTDNIKKNKINQWKKDKKKLKELKTEIKNLKNQILNKKNNLELKNQKIKNLENQIKNLENQIKQKENKLKTVKKFKTNLETQIKNLKTQIKSKKNNLKTEKQQKTKLENEIKNLEIQINQKENESLTIKNKEKIIKLSKDKKTILLIENNIVKEIKNTFYFENNKFSQFELKNWTEIETEITIKINNQEKKYKIKEKIEINKNLVIYKTLNTEKILFLEKKTNNIIHNFETKNIENIYKKDSFLLIKTKNNSIIYNIETKKIIKQYWKNFEVIEIKKTKLYTIIKKFNKENFTFYWDLFLENEKTKKQKEFLEIFNSKTNLKTEINIVKKQIFKNRKNQNFYYEITFKTKEKNYNIEKIILFYNYNKNIFTKTKTFYFEEDKKNFEVLNTEIFFNDLKTKKFKKINNLQLLRINNILYLFNFNLNSNQYNFLNLEIKDIKNLKIFYYKDNLKINLLLQTTKPKIKNWKLFVINEENYFSMKNENLHFFEEKTKKELKKIKIIENILYLFFENQTILIKLENLNKKINLENIKNSEIQILIIEKQKPNKEKYIKNIKKLEFKKKEFEIEITLINNSENSINIYFYNIEKISKKILKIIKKSNFYKQLSNQIEWETKFKKFFKKIKQKLNQTIEKTEKKLKYQQNKYLQNIVFILNLLKNNEYKNFNEILIKYLNSLITSNLFETKWENLEILTKLNKEIKEILKNLKNNLSSISLIDKLKEIKFFFNHYNELTNKLENQNIKKISKKIQQKQETLSKLKEKKEKENEIKKQEIENEIKNLENQIEEIKKTEKLLNRFISKILYFENLKNSKKFKYTKILNEFSKEKIIKLIKKTLTEFNLLDKTETIKNQIENLKNNKTLQNLKEIKTYINEKLENWKKSLKKQQEIYKKLEEKYNELTIEKEFTKTQISNLNKLKEKIDNLIKEFSLNKQYENQTLKEIFNQFKKQSFYNFTKDFFYFIINLQKNQKQKIQEFFDLNKNIINFKNINQTIKDLFSIFENYNKTTFLETNEENKIFSKPIEITNILWLDKQKQITYFNNFIEKYIEFIVKDKILSTNQTEIIDKLEKWLKTKTENSIKTEFYIENNKLKEFEWLINFLEIQKKYTKLITKKTIKEKNQKTEIFEEKINENLLFIEFYIFFKNKPKDSNSNSNDKNKNSNIIDISKLNKINSNKMFIIIVIIITLTILIIVIYKKSKNRKRKKLLEQTLLNQNENKTKENKNQTKEKNKEYLINNLKPKQKEIYLTYLKNNKNINKTSQITKKSKVWIRKIVYKVEKPNKDKNQKKLTNNKQKNKNKIKKETKTNLKNKISKLIKNIKNMFKY